MKTNEKTKKRNNFSLAKLFFSTWIISIVAFLLLVVLSLIFQIQNDVIGYFISLIIVIGVIAFILFFFSVLISGIKRNFDKLYTPIKIDKWYILAVVTVIIFASLVYLKINKGSEVERKVQIPTVMDCLKLGSDDARKACIKYYHPKQ